MSVIVTGMDMPKSCEECPYCKGENDSCLKGCHIPWRAFDNRKYLHKDCPLKSIEGLIKRVEQVKQYKGKSGNPYLNAHDVGLDRYFDLGLDKAIRIIKEYCEVKV